MFPLSAVAGLSPASTRGTQTCGNIGRCSWESSSGRFVFCKIKPQTMDDSNPDLIISVYQQSARERGLQKEVFVYLSKRFWFTSPMLANIWTSISAMTRFVSETSGAFRNLKVRSPMKGLFHTLQEATQSFVSSVP